MGLNSISTAKHMLRHTERERYGQRQTCPPADRNREGKRHTASTASKHPVGAARGEYGIAECDGKHHLYGKRDIHTVNRTSRRQSFHDSFQGN